MNTTDLETFIAGLPKCELHLHLEGTLSPELKLQLAARNGIEVFEAVVKAARGAGANPHHHCARPARKRFPHRPPAPISVRRKTE